MSEPAMRQRQAIDLDEFERRLRSAGQAPKSTDDPLVELARLVGQDDPFKTVFSDPQGRTRHEPDLLPLRDTNGPDPAGAESRRSPAAARFSAGSQTPDVRVSESSTDGRGSRANDWQGDLADHRSSGASREPETAFTAKAPNLYGSSAPRLSDDDSEPWLTDDARLPPTSAQMRAEASPSGSRRGLYAIGGIAGVALLTLGIVYGFKSAGTIRPLDPPVIKAEFGPPKVAPQDAGGPEVAGQDSSVLDRNAGDRGQPTKVVVHEEQPVDLGQAPMGAAASAQPNPASRPVSPLIEPKRVKTVSVRPDGTIIANDAVAAAAAASSAPAVSPAPAARPSFASLPSPVAMPAAKSTEAGKIAETAKLGDSSPSAMPKPATPKSTARVATTPKTVTSAPAPSPADAPLQLAPPAAKPKQVAAIKPPPPAVDDAQTAQAADPTPTGATGGTFAVQLAAPGSEQEARDTSVRLQKKYAAQLGSYRPTIRAADAGGKSVYRVRVGNLSREEAVALCEKLKAGGGACFIAKN